MTYFLKNGNTFRVSSKEAMDLHEKLPAGNYVIKEDMQGNLFLENIGNFEIKGKCYGDLERNCNRILSTFKDRPATTGVMLAGEKGSGKSLLAKAISLEAAETQGVPTIIINAPWSGDKFNSFIQRIDQPTIILFDEFEKVYDSESQEAILTLLDGVFPSKKLFILTCNDKWRIDQHMRNRPGRIYYMLDFAGLTQDFIMEYCEDNLKHLQHVERICQIASLFSQFNFDMLKALVEEMNRYGEAPETALEMLNVKPEFDSGHTRFNIKLSVEGVPLEENDLERTEWKGNPLQSAIHLHYKDYDKTDPDSDDDEDQWEWGNVRFNSNDLKKIDSNTGKFIFVNNENHTLVLTKIKEKEVYFYDAL